MLVNSNCDLKICDFGLARLDDPFNQDRAVMSSYIATRWYRAPEVILGKKRYTKAVDMWSVGYASNARHWHLFMLMHVLMLTFGERQRQ